VIGDELATNLPAIVAPRQVGISHTSAAGRRCLQAEGNARITATGHTDTSDLEAYHTALSLLARGEGRPGAQRRAGAGDHGDPQRRDRHLDLDGKVVGVNCKVPNAHYPIAAPTNGLCERPALLNLRFAGDRTCASRQTLRKLA
jgi:hypothetical protein